MNLKKIRKKIGLSQIEMAKKLQVHINTYIMWEREVANPNDENKAKINKLIKEIERR